MPKHYHHLTQAERCQIYTLRKSGNTLASIAKELGVHRSTIGRELKRNSGGGGYRFQQAEGLQQKRRHQASSTPKKLLPDVIAFIESQLKEEWSPVQISGWMKAKGHAITVSHESIYQYIWAEKRRGGTLYKQLRHSGKKYNKRSSGKAGRGCIPGRVDIDQRPEIVERKERVGDWELDTIIGHGHQGAIVSMVDRASKLTKLARVPNKSAEAVTAALIASLAPIKATVFTLTADNGKEFAHHQKVAQELQADFYFAKPYHSWERGLNEHTNGLVRQYFPKSTNLLEITDAQIKNVEDKLNNRPRKVLQFRTPLEVFSQHYPPAHAVALRC